MLVNENTKQPRHCLKSNRNKEMKWYKQQQILHATGSITALFQIIMKIQETSHSKRNSHSKLATLQKRPNIPFWLVGRIVNLPKLLHNRQEQFSLKIITRQRSVYSDNCGPTFSWTKQAVSWVIFYLAFSVNAGNIMNHGPCSGARCCCSLSVHSTHMTTSMLSIRMFVQPWSKSNLFNARR